MPAFNWKIVASLVLLYLFLRKKDSVAVDDDCECAPYGSDENLASGGLK